MKTNFEFSSLIDNEDWTFSLFPSIIFNYESHNFFHGKQFTIYVDLFIWQFEIDFNEY